MDSQPPPHEGPPPEETQSYYWIPPSAIQTIDDAFHWCQSFVQSLGYEYFFFLMYLPLTPQRKVEIVVKNYPPDWCRRHDEQGYISVDPVVRAAVTGSRPLTWRSLQETSDAQIQAFWEDSRRHGLSDGLVVPLRCAAGGRTCLAMSGRVPDDRDTLQMHLGLAMGFLSELGEHVFEHLLVERWRKRPGASNLLTPRQTEVLRGLSNGMTVKEVARQLRISPRAVQHAMERVLVRLQASSTLEAKFSAWTLGLIGPAIEIFDVPGQRVSMLER